MSRELCCPSHLVETGRLAWNQTAAAAQSRMCNRQEAWKCADLPGALHDPVCVSMSRFYSGLSSTCQEVYANIQECSLGVMLARLNRLRYPKAIAGEDAARDTEWCAGVLKVLRLMFQVMWMIGMADISWFERTYESQVLFCAHIRRRELRRLLPRAALAFAPHGRTAGTRPWVGGRPRIGVIVALAPREAQEYRRTLDVWKCYCRRHSDCEVVVETADFLPPSKYPIMKTIDEGVHKVKYGKAWNRWFALRRHLDSYEWVLTADPDQFLGRDCFGSVSLSEALAAAGVDSGPGPAVVMRDFPRFHTLNSAGIFFRGGEEARLLLDLMFGKMYWVGMGDFDQSAFDQSILELVDLWAGEASGAFGKSSACLMALFPSHKGDASLDTYNRCWHDFMDYHLRGPFARRRAAGSPLALLDPQIVDINYVFVARSSADPPLVWHFAGKDKLLREPDGRTLLDVFFQNEWGLGSLPNGSAPMEEGRDCAIWEQAWASSPRACHPGTPATDCRLSWMAMC